MPYVGGSQALSCDKGFWGGVAGVGVRAWKTGQLLHTHTHPFQSLRNFDMQLVGCSHVKISRGWVGWGYVGCSLYVLFYTVRACD